MGNICGNPPDDMFNKKVHKLEYTGTITLNEKYEVDNKDHHKTSDMLRSEMSRAMADDVVSSIDIT